MAQKTHKTYISVIGKIENLNRIIRDIYQTKDIRFIDTLTEVEEGRFHLPLNEDNIDLVLGFSDLKKLDKKDPFRKEIESLVEIIQGSYENYLEIDPDLLNDRELQTRIIIETAKIFVEELFFHTDRLEKYQKELEAVEQSLKAYSYLQEIEIPMIELNSLKHFSYFVGSLTKENDNRLNMIYQKIPSVMFNLDNPDDNERIFLVITPNDFMVETERVLKSLDFRKIDGYDLAYEKRPAEIINQLKTEKTALEEQIKVLQEKKKEFIERTKKEANLIYNELVLLLSMSYVKNLLAYNKTNFFLTALIPNNNLEEIKRILSSYPDTIVNYDNQDNNSPDITKLHKKHFKVPTNGVINLYKLR